MNLFTLPSSLAPKFTSLPLSSRGSGAFWGSWSLSLPIRSVSRLESTMPLRYCMISRYDKTTWAHGTVLQPELLPFYSSSSSLLSFSDFAPGACQ